MNPQISESIKNLFKFSLLNKRNAVTLNLIQNFDKNLIFSALEINEIIKNIINDPKNERSLEIFLGLVSKSIHINSIFSDGKSLFEMCLRKRNNICLMKIVLKIYQQEIKYKSTEHDINDESLLIFSMKNSDVDLLRLLLRAPGIDYSSLDINKRLFKTKGDTILTWCCNRSDLQLLDLLHSRFNNLINKNLANDLGETPLMLLINRGNNNVIEWFLEKHKNSISVTQTNPNGEDVFYKALRNENYKVFELLWECYEEEYGLRNLNNKYFITVNLLKKKTWKALIYYFEFLQSKKLTLFETKDQTNWAFSLAVKTGNFEIMNYLNEKYQIDYSYVDENNRDLMSLSAECGEIEILRFLLKVAPEIKKNLLKLDNSNENALGWSIKAHNFEVYFTLLNELITEEESLSKIDQSSLEHTLILLTKLSKWDTIIEVLCKNIFTKLKMVSEPIESNNILHFLAKTNQITIFQYLHNNFKFDVEANINRKNKNDETPLVIASRFESFEMLSEILKISCLDFNCKDKSGRTFLNYICTQDKKEIIENLIISFPFVNLNSVLLDLISFDKWENFLLIEQMKGFDYNFKIKENQHLLQYLSERSEAKLEKYLTHIIKGGTLRKREIYKFDQIIKNLIIADKYEELQLLLNQNVKFDISFEQCNLLLEEIAKICETPESFQKYFNLIFPLLIVEMNESHKMLEIQNEDDLLAIFTKEENYIFDFFSPIHLGQSIMDVIIARDYIKIAHFIIGYVQHHKLYIPNFTEIMIKIAKEKKYNLIEIFMNYEFWDFRYAGSNDENFLNIIIKDKQLELVEKLKKKFIFLTNLAYFVNVQELCLYAAEKSDSDLLFLMLDKIDDQINKFLESENVLKLLLLNGSYEIILKIIRKYNFNPLNLFNSNLNSLSIFNHHLKNGKINEIKNLAEFSRQFNELDIPIITLNPDNVAFMSHMLEENINMLRFYGFAEYPREKLIDNKLISDAIRNNESTQMSVVDMTIKTSIERLLNKFPLDQNQILQANNEIAQLFQSLILSLPSKFKVNILAAIKTLRLIKLKCKLPFEFSELEFVSIAKTQYENMFALNDYIHISAKIGNRHLLALIWNAIHDIEELNITSEEEKEEIIIIRKVNLMRNLIEAKSDGICSRGQFNKALESLNYSHSLVKIHLVEFDQKEIAGFHLNLNLIYRQLMLDSFTYLTKKIKEKMINQSFLWRELNVFEQQHILGSLKKSFFQNFENFYGINEKPTMIHFICLEDMLGFDDKNGMLDYTWVEME